MKLKIELITENNNGRDLCTSMLEQLFKALCSERITPTVEEDGRYCLIVEMTVKDIYCWHEKLTPFFNQYLPSKIHSAKKKAA